MNRFTPAILAVSLIVLFTLFGSVAHAQEDITPPSLLNVSFEPTEIDTSKGPVTVTVSVHVTDDLSGVDWVYLNFAREGTTQGVGIDITPGKGFGEHIEGDKLDSVWENSFMLPQYSAFGEWQLTYVMLADSVGNRSDSWKSEDGENLRGDSEEWPSLFNGFAFVVKAGSGAVRPNRRLFIPLVNP